MRAVSYTLYQYLLCSCLLALLPVQLSAQSVFSAVKGYVLDTRTALPLTGAVISLSNGDKGIGTVTDTAGYFVLSNVPVGYQSVQVSYVGYETFIEKGIYVSTGRENVLEVYLTPSDQVLDAVMVSTARATTSDLSLVRLQPIKQGERLAGGFNDVGRMLLSYAGVQTILDGSNQIVVRGTGPFGFGWRINGIPMADPNHFSSTAQSGGAIGLISTYVLDKADFYSGAIPANMGNALSGVMDMQLRKGDREKFNTNLRIGMVGLDAMLEGPFTKKKKASYLANYRFSTITLIEKMGINVHGTEFTDGDISTNFQDLCIGVHIPVGERVSMLPFLIAGRSKSINDFSSGNNRREDNFYRMATTGLSVQHRLNEHWSWRSTMALEMVQFKLFAAQRFTYPFMSKFADRSFDNNRENAVTISHKLSAEATYQPTVKHKLQAGGLMQYFDFDFSYRNYAWWALDLDEDGIADTVYVADTIEAGSGGLKSWYYEFFLNWQYKISPRWVLEAGLQFNQAVFNKHANIEPRLKLTFRPARNHTLSLATGMQSRLLPYVYYAASIYNIEDPQPNKDTDFEKVVHLVLGYSWQFASDFILKAELYFQHLYAVPVEIPGSPGYDPHYSPLNDVFA